MTYQATDHSNQTFGALRVYDRHPQHRGYYLIHWACCGEDNTMGAGTVGRYANRPSMLCKVCTEAKRSRARAEANAAHAKPAPAGPPKGIITKGWGWSPFLQGPMGPRGSGYGPPSNINKGV